MEKEKVEEVTVVEVVQQAREVPAVARRRHRVQAQVVEAAVVLAERSSLARALARAADALMSSKCPSPSICLAVHSCSLRQQPANQVPR